MKLKNILLTGLSFVLVAAIAVTGTVAFLTSTDSDVNVMTLENVSIEQIEQERDADGNLVDFTQAKPVFPAVYEGTSIPWASEEDWHVSGDPAWKVVEDNANVVDKFVSVKNTGKSDAFVRTIIAFEAGKDKIGEPYMHFVCNDSPATLWDFEWATDENGNDITIEIDGSVYYIGVFTYEEALKPGVTTVPNVKQVYLDKTATNEVCAAYGDTFEILVLSQAVQTAGFADAKTALDAGFGDTTAANVAKWFGGIELPVGDIVTNSDDLADAIASGEDAVITYTGSEDFVIDEDSNISGDVTINFFGTDADLVIEETLNVTGNLTITNATVDTDAAGEIVVDGGSLTLGKGAVLSVDSEMPAGGVIRVIDDSEIVLDGAEIKDCDNKGTGVLINVAAGAKMTIEDGTVISGNTVAGSGNTPYALIKVCGELIMNGGEITNNEFAHRALISIEGGKFVMNGGLISNNTYTGTSSTSIFYFFTRNAKFEMNGGTITDNNLGANSSSAVFNTFNNSNSGALVVNGGTVQNNIAGNRDSFAYIDGLTSISIDSAANVSGIVNDPWNVGQKDVNDIKK